VSQRGPVALLRLSRPAKRNALDAAMLAGIEGFFADPPEGTRAIIVYGEGKHFFGWRRSFRADDVSIEGSLRLLAGPVHRAFEKIENSEVPVIAVLAGCGGRWSVWNSPPRAYPDRGSAARRTVCRKARWEFSWAEAARSASHA